MSIPAIRETDDLEKRLRDLEDTLKRIEEAKV